MNVYAQHGNTEGIGGVITMKGWLLIVLLSGVIFGGAIALNPPKSAGGRGVNALGIIVGSKNESAEKVVLRVYPRAKLTFLQNYSGATGRVITYRVTLPKGGVLYVCCDFMADPETLDLAQAYQTGHYLCRSAKTLKALMDLYPDTSNEPVIPVIPKEKLRRI